MPNSEKKSEFTVTDRRRFSDEGEARPDVAAEEPKEEPPKVVAPPPAGSKPGAVVTPETAPAPEEPPAPTTAEQNAQHAAYQQSTKDMESQFRGQVGGPGAQQFEMNFERLVASFYMTAVMQLGLDQQGEQRRVDPIGARQTIDTIGILQEKTKGNLTAQEDAFLRNALYELRMAYVETMNAIARSVQQPGGGGQPGK